MLLMNLESRPVIFEDVARQVNLKMAYFTKYFNHFIIKIHNIQPGGNISLIDNLFFLGTSPRPERTARALHRENF